MSYECSFSLEFWLAEGEPYDRSDLALNAQGKPTSVYSAICMAIRDPGWCEHAREWLREALGGIAVEDAMPEILLDVAEKIDTCGTLKSPVDVWLTPGGEVTVEVWDEL